VSVVVKRALQCCDDNARGDDPAEPANRHARFVGRLGYPVIEVALRSRFLSACG
jgi:hypothetical protein